MGRALELHEIRNYALDHDQLLFLFLPFVSLLFREHFMCWIMSKESATSYGQFRAETWEYTGLLVREWDSGDWLLGSLNHYLSCMPIMTSTDLIVFLMLFMDIWRMVIHIVFDTPLCFFSGALRFHHAFIYRDTDPGAKNIRKINSPFPFWYNYNK